jgi:hypothetical protein
MPIPACGLSVAEFCQIHGFSRAQYKNWQRKGIGPRETLFPDTNVRRIMPKDYEDWLARVQQPDVQLAEAMRRTAAQKRYGKLALKSPRHPANLMQQVLQAGLANKKPKGKVRKQLVAAE